MIRLLVCISIIFALAGCAHVDVDQHGRDPYWAAGADLVTTAAALGRGAHELNPLGVQGALITKGIYLFAIRPGISVDQRAQSDRVAASIWYGAAANNLMVILFPGAGLASLALGAWVGWELYRDQ